MSIINDEDKTLAMNIEINARKLAVLLQASDMPDDVKSAWVELLPEMSLEQIERLIQILEDGYLDSQTGEVDEAYAEKLEAVLKS